jgi:outer membrane biogenesis lipoprotein LolB
MRAAPAILCLLLVSCAHRFKGPLPDAAALWAQAQAAHRLPATVSAEGKAFVDAPENGGRYALNLSVKKPDSLRIEALTPLGDPAAVLIAHEGRFALLDLRNHVFYRGPSTPENLSRLLPAPLRDDELVALFTGGIPELVGAEPVEVRRDGDDVRLVLSTVPPGAAEQRGYQQEVLLGYDLRVKEVLRSALEGGGPRLLWTVRLDNYDDSSGQQVPLLLHLSVPAQRTEVDLRLHDLLVGLPPPSSAFALLPPPGVAIRELP